MIRLILTLVVMAVSVVPAVVSAQDQDETAEWTPSHLADGQPDIALSHGHACDGVHHEHHVFAFVAKVLGDGGGDLRALDTDEGRLIGGGHDDAGSGEAFRPQVAVDEGAYFPSALANQGDDIDVGFGVSCNHA